MFAVVVWEGDSLEVGCVELRAKRPAGGMRDEYASEN